MNNDARKIESMVIAAALYLLAIFFAYRLPFWFSHPLLIWADQSVYLAMADLVLHGQKPYIDFFDFNPPLIIYLNVIPVWLSAVLKQPIILMFDCFVYAVTAVSLCLTAIQVYLNRNTASKSILLFLLFVPLLCTQTMLFNFGQREHLFVLAYFPFMLMRVLRATEDGIRPPALLSLVTGLFAAVGLALKPQFLVTALIVELALFIECRRAKRGDIWRTSNELTSAAAFIVLYICAFAIFLHDGFVEFFSQSLPLYLHGSKFYRIGFIESLMSLRDFSAIYYCLCAALIAFFVSRKSLYSYIFLVFALVSLISYLQAGTIYSYRAIPVLSGSYMVLLVALAQFMEKILSGFRTRVAFVVLLILSSTFYCYSQAMNCRFDPSLGEEVSLDLTEIGYPQIGKIQAVSPVLEVILKNSKPSDSVLFLSEGVRPGFPATLQSKRQSASRYLHGMIMPMLLMSIPYNRPKYSAMLQKVVDDYGRDIAAQKPALIFVDQQYIEPLLAQYHFISRYMADYERLTSLEQLRMIVYKRKAEAGGSAP